MRAICKLGNRLEFRLGLIFGMSAIVLMASPARAAEQIYLEVGPLLFSLSVESLETFVQEGKITKEFARYANQFDRPTREQFRQALQRPYEMDEVTVYRMTEIPVVVDFLRGLGEVINTPSGINGFYAIRSALVLAAAQEGSWTLMDVIRQFPTDIRIDTALAMQRFPMGAADAVHYSFLEQLPNPSSNPLPYQHPVSSHAP
jgi:hypothetical protein